MRTIIKNANLITPYRSIPNGAVIIEDSKIFALIEDQDIPVGSGDQIINGKGYFLAPGFIDTHTHGAGNADFMDGSIEAGLTACKTHLQFGTTSILPTTLASSMEDLLFNLGILEQVASQVDGMPNILGFHLEGPYFSPSQKGAQDPKYLKNPDPQEYMGIFERYPSIIRWTVAPELPGALEMGLWMRKNGIVASIGHSNAEYDDVVRAFENGYQMVTHLYNGMSRLTRRNALMYLGVAESALLIEPMNVEVIADGKHLPPNLVKLIYNNKGSDHICLVTDSIRAAGLDVKESILGGVAHGQKVIIDDGVAYMPDRNSFGGSIATANRLVKVMVQSVGVPITEAVQMITSTPARIHHVDHIKGTLSSGKDADIVLFDQNFEIQFVMVKGNIWKNQLGQSQ